MGSTSGNMARSESMMFHLIFETLGSEKQPFYFTKRMALIFFCLLLGYMVFFHKPHPTWSDMLTLLVSSSWPYLLPTLWSSRNPSVPRKPCFSPTTCTSCLRWNHTCWEVQYLSTPSCPEPSLHLRNLRNVFQTAPKPSPEPCSADPRPLQREKSPKKWTAHTGIEGWRIPLTKPHFWWPTAMWPDGIRICNEAPSSLWMSIGEYSMIMTSA